MNDLISVVVPAYNAEKYIKKCIESILNQTYKNIELIIINDGSKDNTARNIKSFDDGRIKYIEQENKGVSRTRNLGIEKSKGKYLMFVDADDYIAADYVEKMYNYLKNNKCSVVVSGMTQVDSNYNILTNTKYKNGNTILVFEDIFPEIINTLNFCSACKTLFDLEKIRLNKIEFKENLKFGEDMLFSFENLFNAESIGYIDSCGYYYVKNEESITNNTTVQIFEIYCDNTYYALNYIKKLTKCDDTIIANRLLSKLNTAYKKISHLKYKEFKNRICENHKKYLTNNGYDKKIDLEKIDYENKINLFLIKLLKNKLYFIYYIILKLR